MRRASSLDRRPTCLGVQHVSGFPSIKLRLPVVLSSALLTLGDSGGPYKAAVCVDASELT